MLSIRYGKKRGWKHSEDRRYFVIRPSSPWAGLQVPVDWKLANVTPVVTKGKEDNTGNYRPPIFTPVPGRIMEKVILGVFEKALHEGTAMPY